MDTITREALQAERLFDSRCLADGGPDRTENPGHARSHNGLRGAKVAGLVLVLAGSGAIVQGFATMFYRPVEGLVTLVCGYGAIGSVIALSFWRRTGPKTVPSTKRPRCLIRC